MEVVDADSIASQLVGRKYLAEPGLVNAAVLALRLGRPLFLEGEPGVGKSSFAKAMAELRGGRERLIRLQCHNGLDSTQALYDWDFPRQVLTLRAAAEGRAVDVGALYRKEYLARRPILRAFETDSAVLLIDEIDRADDEFEACLLEVLDDRTISIPELAAGDPLTLTMPLVVLTSNQTREVHDALKRRCIYHWIERPEPAREVEILLLQVKGLTERLAWDIATAMESVRKIEDLERHPGIAEEVAMARALVGFGAASLSPDLVRRCVGSIAKTRNDLRAVLALLGGPVPEPRNPS